VLARGPHWVGQRRKGALVELSMAHVDALDGYFAGYLPARTEVAWVPAALLACVFAVDWMAGLVLLLTAPMVPVFMMLVGWGAEAAGRGQLLALARAGAHFGDRLRGLDLIRAYGRGEAELAGVAVAADEVRDRSMRVLRIAFLSSTVLEFFASVSVAMVAVYFGFRYLGLLDVGPAMAPGLLFTGLFCLLLAPEFYAPLRRLAAHYHDRANALAAVAEIEHAFERLPGDADESRQATQARTAEPADATRDANAPPAGASLAAQGLSVQGLAVRHAGAVRPLFEGLHGTLAPGQRLALVGASGSGKSSLLDVLAGSLAPDAGTVQRPPGSRVALAAQRPWIFRGTLADNIRLGAAGATDAEVLAAARVAQVWRFAQHLPAGLDSEVGERGVGLSGGEARRVALARALLRAPDLLLLDEPTAFLDPATEADLLRALADATRGRMVVVATHSPAVMAWAGRCLGLPGGTCRAWEAR